jgi:hypothetical protein
MNLAATDNDPADKAQPDPGDAWAALIGLARMSRLNLLYYRGDQRDAGAPLLLQAARRRGGDEIALLFDEWEEAPLPMVQQRLDEAVNAADPGAAPYFGDLPGALAHWQQAQGLRFFVMLYGFERHLRQNPDSPDVAEFDRALIRLASDPMLELHLLLCMDEDAAPALDRLRPFIADLGQEYLRMPELPGAAPRPPEQATPRDAPQALAPPAFRPDREDASPPAPEEPTLPNPDTWHVGGAPPAGGQPEPRLASEPGVAAPADDAEPVLPILPPGAERSDSPRGPDRRRRDFSSLIESLPHETPADLPQPQPAVMPDTHARADAPMRVYPWFHDHLRQRRSIALRLAVNGILASTVIGFVMLVAMTLLYAMPQLGIPPASDAANGVVPAAQAASSTKTLSFDDIARALGLRLH